MDQISSKNIKGFSESLKPRNQETLKLRNQETKKSRNRKPRNHETNKLFQVRESPAPLNIPTPTLHPGRCAPEGARDQVGVPDVPGIATGGWELAPALPFIDAQNSRYLVSVNARAAT